MRFPNTSITKAGMRFPSTSILKAPNNLVRGKIRSTSTRRKIEDHDIFFCPSDIYEFGISLLLPQNTLFSVSDCLANEVVEVSKDMEDLKMVRSLRSV
ncbi:hypothetical protein SDJN03_01092, partial [Cucurbita argyrosperma subsp. sororia]